VVKALRVLETRNRSAHLVGSLRACRHKPNAEVGLIDKRGDYFGREGPEVDQVVGGLSC
jgi:hypothetical protein